MLAKGVKIFLGFFLLAIAADEDHCASSESPKDQNFDFVSSIDPRESLYSARYKASLLKLASQKKTSNPLIPLKGGKFQKGTNSPIIESDFEGPARQVTLAPFSLQKYEVSILEFAHFVAETNHETDAETFGWSFVFDKALSEAQNSRINQAVQQAPWWLPTPFASWFLPVGADLAGLDQMEFNQSHLLDLPVAHVSYTDALAYCKYHSMSLPSEAEFEFAASLDSKENEDKFPWGSELISKTGKHRTNIWQGDFPETNSADDGYVYAAPVTAFEEQNSAGFHNLIGNVWEWTSSEWEGGPGERVKKGGSFMCHISYCYRYRVHARSHNTVDSSAQNLGFRCRGE